MEEIQSSETGKPQVRERNLPRPIFWVLIVFLVPLDQVTKIWIERNYHWGQSEPVIEGFFNLVFVKNDGIAFGMFQGNNFLMGIVVCLVLALAFWQARKFNWRSQEVSLLGGILVSGAVGNLTDRVRVGYVIDFLDFHIGQHHWPAFNVADSCISISVVWIIYRLMTEGRG